jgi:hypothetical protein
MVCTGSHVPGQRRPWVTLKGITGANAGSELNSRVHEALARDAQRL